MNCLYLTSVVFDLDCVFVLALFTWELILSTPVIWFVVGGSEKLQRFQLLTTSRDCDNFVRSCLCVVSNYLFSVFIVTLIWEN